MDGADNVNMQIVWTPGLGNKELFGASMKNLSSELSFKVSFRGIP